MKVLVFDTETTGLPTERNASITQPWKWPHIVQISYIMYDTDTRTMLSVQDHIIKIGEEVVITPGSQKIHGISKSQCNRSGIDIKTALDEFNTYLRQADVVVGHNISFDKRMVMVESIRNRMSQYFTVDGRKKTEYCTMKRATEFCSIEATSAKGEKYFKYPTLSELHIKLFKDTPNGVHDSMADVLICLRCYAMLEYKNDITRGKCVKLKNLYKLYRILD